MEELSNDKEEIKSEFCLNLLHKYSSTDDGICNKIVNNIPIKCNLLKHTHPKIYSEIDIEKTLLMDTNKFDPRKRLTKEKIENITYGSNIKLWFKCIDSKCGCIHSYEARTPNRTNMKSACPYCCNKGKNKKMCSCNIDSFMNDTILANEWDYEKNGDLDPWQISKGSHIEVWWICRDHTLCKEHSWKTPICDRTRGRGCPFCSSRGGAGHQTCICNSISRTHPRLCLDIPKRLNSEIDLEKISYGSGQIINFECYLCKFIWQNTLHHRTILGASDRCPQCTTKCSDFEYNCKEILLKLNLNPIVQQKLHYIPTRRYDFIFQYNGIVYLIETDGGSHFIKNSCWHPTDEIFIERQNADRIKTIIPIFYNYVIIRLSNDNSQHIENCIKYILSLKLSKPSIIFDDVQKYLYIANDIFHNPDKVNYLIDNFVDQNYKDHCKELYKTTNFDILDLKTNKIWTNYI